MPTGWSIDMSGMPVICKDCLNIIDELDEAVLCMRWEDENQMNRFRKNLARARENLATIIARLNNH